MFPGASPRQDRSRGSRRGLGKAAPPSLQPPSPRATRHPTRPREVASRVSEGRAEGSAEAPRSGRGRRRGTEPCHRSLLSGLRSVSGPPAAFAFPATDTSGQLHFLLRSRVTFSSSRGSGQAASAGRKPDPQSRLDLGDGLLGGPRNTLLPSRHTPAPQLSCPWLQPAVCHNVPLPRVDTKCTPITAPPSPAALTIAKKSFQAPWLLFVLALYKVKELGLSLEWC